MERPEALEPVETPRDRYREALRGALGGGGAPQAARRVMMLAHLARVGITEHNETLREIQMPKGDLTTPQGNSFYGWLAANSREASQLCRQCGASRLPDQGACRHCDAEVRPLRARVVGFSRQSEAILLSIPAHPHSASIKMLIGGGGLLVLGLVLLLF